jgi:alkanesulfonate monooxygenase SsuD/methylene tetrahydromethanopterin reductase-like flavin-dependent oxidoreductase (luciferase family)
VKFRGYLRSEVRGCPVCLGAVLRQASDHDFVVVTSAAQTLPARPEEARRHFGALVDIDRVATAGIPERCVEAIRRQIAQGISSVVCLFPDGGQPETIRLFGERVLPAFA